MNDLSSTEIYVQSAWSIAASLPSPRSYLSAATVDISVLVFGDNIIIYHLIFLKSLCTGAHDGARAEVILQYVPESDTWTNAGRMKTHRDSHSVMSLSDISQLSHLCDPVDGSWGSWTDWSSCKGRECGRESQSRTRKCDDPRPLNGGAECPGSDEGVQSCNTENCLLGEQ